MSETTVPNSFGGDGRERGEGAREFRSFCPLVDTHQVWLACVEPKTLVSQYKEFVHGSRSGDRRVVLEESLLRTVEESGNIRVVPPKVLLERFLATLRSETQIAFQEEQPVLVFIFGHGTAGNFSVAVGGECSDDRAPTLTRDEFNAAIQTGVSLSLCITSCFSGGWVLKPRAAPSLHQSKKLNISGMTATNADEVSVSWACSRSCGLAGGSVWATAVTNALINMSTMSSHDSSGAAIDESPAYTNLCRSTYEAYKGYDPFYNTHQVSFSAQDDTWDCEWRTRSGFPLSDYKSKWEELRQVVSAGASETPTSDRTAALGFSGSIGRGYHNVVKSKARAYMSSHFGPDNAGENTAFHPKLKKLLSGTSYPEEVLVYLNDELDYRLSVMDRASDYVSLLGLQFADCLNFDTTAWLNGMALQVAGAGASANTQARFEKYNRINEYICTKLFNCVPPSLGYCKPRHYLAIALMEPSLSLEEMYDAIDSLVRFKNGAQQALIKTSLAQAMMKSDEVVRYLDKLHEAVGKVRARLRSLSPSKRNRASLP